MMALNTRVALLAALMGSTVPAGVWAQTAVAPTAAPAAATTTTTETTTTGTTAPAADAAAKPAADAAAKAAADAAADAAAQPAADAAKPADAAADAVKAAADAAAAPATDAAKSAADAATSAADAAKSAADAASTAAATTTANTTAAPAAAPAGAAAPVRSGPPQPAASEAAAQVGEFYLDGQQGDWQVRCQKTPDGKNPCELYQLMRDAQSNPVAEVSIVPLSGKAVAGVTIVAPLETDLLPGLGFKVDTGKAVGYPFSFCSPVGCFSRVAFTQAEVDGLKKGSTVTVTLVPYGAPQNTKVDLTMSLKGFTAGFDAVKAKMPAAPAAPTAAPAAAPKAN